LKSLVVTASAAITVTLLLATTMTHPAFALQHLFNCITDISNKDGGDHNLTLQQVIDCFKKEFPNNPGTSHFDSSLTDHLPSQILNVP